MYIVSIQDARDISVNLSALSGIATIVGTVNNIMHAAIHNIQEIATNFFAFAAVHLQSISIIKYR